MKEFKSLEELETAILRTANYDTYTLQEIMTIGALGLGGESGEVLDIIKKVLFQGKPLDGHLYNKLMDELSDVTWYLLFLINGLGLTTRQVMEHNIEKLNKEYPNGFSIEAAIEREAKKVKE